MCDTLYMERGEKVYFGKNSDRSPNEAHLMARKRAADYPAGAMLKATYISLPQGFPYPRLRALKAALDLGRGDGLE